MKMSACALGAAALLALSPISGGHLQQCAGGGIEHREAVVQEDDPRFDCRIDGNQICGPVNPGGFAAGYYGLGDCTNVAGLIKGTDVVASGAQQPWELMLP